MPTIPVNEESPSVFDGLFEQVMRRMKPSAPDVSDLAGLSGPISLASPLIAKIPFNQMRPRNSALIDLLKQDNAPPELQQAVQFAAQKYPRILAHVNDVRASTLGKGTLGMNFTMGPRSWIDVDPTQIAKYRGRKNLEKGVAETFGHELTHAAQNVWNGKSFNPMYNASMDNWGYHDNIFEEGARKGGENFSKKLTQTLPPKSTQSSPSVLDRLIDMFDLSK